MPLLIISFLLGSGCGILKPPHKDAQGFYTAHYYSCGPEAVQEALTRYCQVNGIKFKKPLTRREISQDIQRNAPPFICNKRKLLIILDRDAAEITWPSEIRAVCKKYGVKLTRVAPSKLLQRDNPHAVYIVLCHKKRTFNNYHWLTYPGNPAHYFGNNTAFDIVYLLELQ